MKKIAMIAVTNPKMAYPKTEKLTLLIQWS
jgi:hypothetical protein